MDDIILYPTETVYGLGVNALHEQSLHKLFACKCRESKKAVSWLVRNKEDIKRFAICSPKAELIIDAFMPGPLTLVLPVRDEIPTFATTDERTVGFRISADTQAQTLIEEYMSTVDTPLTCTSANVSGYATLTTPESIIEQFKACNRKFTGFERIIDDGPRSGVPSTVVRVMNDEVLLLREGAIPFAQIRAVIE